MEKTQAILIGLQIGMKSNHCCLSEQTGNLVFPGDILYFHFLNYKLIQSESQNRP